MKKEKYVAYVGTYTHENMFFWFRLYFHSL